jgi:hypothetical protein
MQVTGNNIPFPHKSIRLSMDGLSFFHANTWKRIDFSANDLQLNQALARLLCEEALQDSVCAYIEAYLPYTALIPSQLLNKQDALSLFKFHFPETDSNQMVVCWQEIPTFNLTLLFGIPQAHYQLACQLFQQIQWNHHLYQHLSHCLKITKQKGETQAWIWADSIHIHIAIANNGALLFSNYFPVSNQQDILYYTAKVFEQYQLSQQHTPCYIMGNKTTYNTLVNHLAQCQYINDYAHC